MTLEVILLSVVAVCVGLLAGVFVNLTTEFVRMTPDHRKLWRKSRFKFYILFELAYPIPVPHRISLEIPTESELRSDLIKL